MGVDQLNRTVNPEFQSLSHIIFSPYRISPLGAHIDHQGGPVMGRTLALGTTLTYTALNEPLICLKSEQFGDVEFGLGVEIDRSHWARYAQAAARVLGGRLRRGMQAHIRGSLIGAGLSSSASVGLAYLKALAEINAIPLQPADLVRMDFELENGQLGLQNGLLDPLSIVHGKKDALLWMDTLTAQVTAIPDPPQPDWAWIAVYSGISRELTKSGYNVRVAECQEAAALLRPGAARLSDVPREVFDRRKVELPENLCRRAEHFYGEVERVGLGAEAWKRADAAAFGELMNRSCASSIGLYQSGSPILIELHELVSAAGGVLGSRFSGGGYGGVVVGLARRAAAEDAVRSVEETFRARHPELPARGFVLEMGDGLR
jgi:galactokinase/galacturonokinase